MRGGGGGATPSCDYDDAKARWTRAIERPFYDARGRGGGGNGWCASKCDAEADVFHAAMTSIELPRDARAPLDAIEVYEGCAVAVERAPPLANHVHLQPA